MIWIQTDFRFDSNQSENGKSNLISGWFNKIQKIFLCVHVIIYYAIINYLIIGGGTFSQPLSPHGCNCFNFHNRFKQPSPSFYEVSFYVELIYTQRNLFEIMLNQPEIRLYLPFSDSLGTKRTFVWSIHSDFGWFNKISKRFLCMYVYSERIFLYISKNKQKICMNLCIHIYYLFIGIYMGNRIYKTHLLLFFVFAPHSTNHIISYQPFKRHLTPRKYHTWPLL